MVRIANVIARYNGRVQIKSISFLYHLFFIVISVVFAVRVSRKKPGTHNAEKPKGIDNTIFHVGIFIVRMRQILAYVLEINRPVKYSNANVSMLNKISVCVVGNNNSVIINNNVIADTVRQMEQAKAAYGFVRVKRVYRVK